MDATDVVIERVMPQLSRVLGWIAPLAVAFVMGGRKPRPGGR